FPGRQISQLASLGNAEEWAVLSINSHHGKGEDAMFKLTWKSGDHAWLPYHEVSHLEALNQYLEAHGIANISKLPRKISKDETVPVGRISPVDSRRLQNLIIEVISDMKVYQEQGNQRHQMDKGC